MGPSPYMAGSTDAGPAGMVPDRIQSLYDPGYFTDSASTVAFIAAISMSLGFICS
jgi:hypothetical protein